MDVKLAELLEVGFGGGLGHHFDAMVGFVFFMDCRGPDLDNLSVKLSDGCRRLIR